LTDGTNVPFLLLGVMMFGIGGGNARVMLSESSYPPRIIFRDHALLRDRSTLTLEWRQLHALTARELRQGFADDQCLERVRLLMCHKGRLVGEQLIEEKTRSFENKRCGQNNSVPGSDFTASAMRRRMSATASPSPSFASHMAASVSGPAAGAAPFVTSIILLSDMFRCPSLRRRHAKGR
jgi:hypothetical protein